MLSHAYWDIICLFKTAMALLSQSLAMLSISSMEGFQHTGTVENHFKLSVMAFNILVKENVSFFLFSL